MSLWPWQAQFVGIGVVVGAQALGNLRAQHAPEGGPLLLALASASAVLLSALCAAKWRLSVRGRPSATPMPSGTPDVCKPGLTHGQLGLTVFIISRTHSNSGLCNASDSGPANQHDRKSAGVGQRDVHFLQFDQQSCATFQLKGGA